MILDEKEIYHIGASLKDLSKKWFAFSKFEMEAFEILHRLKHGLNETPIKCSHLPTEDLQIYWHNKL